jgi:methylated-DNA-[protein]-cysteine S-methyltransferase
MRWTLVDSPIGDLLLLGGDGVVRGLYMQPARPPAGAQRDDAAFAAPREQLREYFAGERTSFDLPLEMDGTDFQRRVWGALREIPYGETRSYGELSRDLGLGARGARAVGLANGRNPISVIVPCHRVIGADGSLTGFGGGLDRKRILLELEAGATALF